METKVYKMIGGKDPARHKNSEAGTLVDMKNERQGREDIVMPMLHYHISSKYSSTNPPLAYKERSPE
jgi:hypothetical protein